MRVLATGDVETTWSNIWSGPKSRCSVAIWQALSVVLAMPGQWLSGYRPRVLRATNDQFCQTGRLPSGT